MTTKILVSDMTLKSEAKVILSYLKLQTPHYFTVDFAINNPAT